MYSIVKSLINTKGSIPTGMDSSFIDVPKGKGREFHPYGDG